MSKDVIQKGKYTEEENTKYEELNIRQCTSACKLTSKIGSQQITFKREEFKKLTKIFWDFQEGPFQILEKCSLQEQK